MKTICLSGSGRFETTFKTAMKELSNFGFSVHTMSSFPSDRNGEEVPIVRKEILDLAYFGKILQSDFVLVIDTTHPSAADVNAPASYIGYSTAREILWAIMNNKIVLPLHQFTSYENIAEVVYDVVEQEDQFELFNMASKMLAQACGMNEVDEAQQRGQFDILHAALSFIASSMQADELDPPYYATKILEFAGLDPMPAEQFQQLLNYGELLVVGRDKGKTDLDVPLGDPSEPYTPPQPTYEVNHELPNTKPRNWSGYDPKRQEIIDLNSGDRLPWSAQQWDSGEKPQIDEAAIKDLTVENLKIG